MGDGIYFAEDPAATGRKTRHYGCMIEVLVRLGRIYDLGEGYGHQTNGEWLLHHGYDAATVVDMTKEHYGREFQIFYKDQVVDMLAYPCDGTWTDCEDQATQYKCKTPPTGKRTGSNLSGKANFTEDEWSSIPCQPSNYSLSPKLAAAAPQSGGQRVVLRPR
jgi:hypothetical protein